MKTYKVVFSCQSVINKIPDAQALFGAICTIIKYTKGEQALEEYLTSFNKSPLLLHSSMFYNGVLPMTKKNIFPLSLINQVVNQSENEFQLNILEKIKKYKNIHYISEKLYMKYLVERDIECLKSDILENENNFEIQNDILCEKSEDLNYSSNVVLMTRNGETETLSVEKSLFYTQQIYYPRGSEFCVFVKTDRSINYLCDIFSYLEYFGIGNRKSIGMNIFRLEKIEEVSLTSKKNEKMIFSKYIPNEDVDYSRSYYQMENQIYRTSKDYANNAIVGKFVHITEGSCMYMKEDKEYYGKVLKTDVNGKPLYHYAIGFTF